MNPARKNAELMGVVNAGWADSGLHAETFWLGYAAGTAAGWNPAAPGAEQATANFYRLFYGWKAVDMDKVYRLMTSQAQFWSDKLGDRPLESAQGYLGEPQPHLQPPPPGYRPVHPASAGAHRGAEIRLLLVEGQCQTDRPRQGVPGPERRAARAARQEPATGRLQPLQPGSLRFRGSGASSQPDHAGRPEPHRPAAGAGAGCRRREPAAGRGHRGRGPRPGPEDPPRAQHPCCTT